MVTPIRVLLVEDEESVLVSLSANLELDGFEVSEATSAKSALELLQRGAEVDLVLTDIKMPGQSGIELAERIRALRPELPVVLMTAFTAAEDLGRGLLTGVFTVLTKPFDIDNAVATLRRASRRPKVLIVDDREEDALSLAAALENVGVDVMTAFDGEAALEVIARGGVDVCITDLRMPGMDGAEVVEAVRAAGRMVDCIVFSGHDVPAMMQRAAAQGVVACLRKPVEVTRLLEVIARARSRARMDVRDAADP